MLLTWFYLFFVYQLTNNNNIIGNETKVCLSNTNIIDGEYPGILLNDGGVFRDIAQRILSRIHYITLG